MQLKVVILAAGKGKRMNSNLPKVLHSLAGKTLIEHVVDTASQFDYMQQPIVVYGYQGQMIQDALKHRSIAWAEQKEQLGTGHALKQALPYLNDATHVLVLYGDIPLTSFQTLENFIANTAENALGIITAHLPNPTGFGGRIIRDDQNNIICVVEEKDATEKQLAIKEVNSGFYIIPVKYLRHWMENLQNNNAQQEYYLTDIIHLAAKANTPIHATHPDCYEEILGVNSPSQLASLEKFIEGKGSRIDLRHV